MAEYIWIDSEGMCFSSGLSKEKNGKLTDNLSNLQATPAQNLAYVLSPPCSGSDHHHHPSPVTTAAIGICATTKRK